MTRNVRPLKWKLCALAGIVLLSAAFFVEWPGVWEGIVGLAGAALLATALARFGSTRSRVYAGPERRHALTDRRQNVSSRGARYLDRRDGPRERRRYAAG